MDPSEASLPLRRRSSANVLVRDEDGGLTQSLSQLSISNADVPSSPSAGHGPKSPRVARQSTPLPLPKSRHASPSPARRMPSRSPSQTRTADSGGPTLLRKASTNSLRSANGMGPGKPPSRRSSSAQIMSPKSPLWNATPIEEPPPPLTANSVAHSHFEAELEAHHSTWSSTSTQAVVILHDAVYGHRFSRPRTTRGALSTIVERPERIKASVLGVSSAYVRLGQRHSEGAFPPHPRKDVRKLPTVPFRIHKTSRALPLMAPAVTNVHGSKWMEELQMMCDSAEAKLAMGGKELQRPDIPRAADQPAPKKLHEGDLYLCLESRDAIEGALGAVCEAVDMVFGDGPRRAFVGVRPPGHHCSASHPSGFCWVNNVHVGIMHAVLTHGLTHAAIIDFDLHHGDGSQDIAWQHNARSVSSTKNTAAWKKSSIGYFSLHDINSYPCEMGDQEKVKNASLCIDNAHGQNMWNVHLQSWKTEQEFWQLYETRYSILLEKTRSYLKTQADRVREANLAPKAAIFLSAGFDASEWESAGMQRHQVNVPTAFYARLTQDVVKLAAEQGLSVEGRVISVLEGGYSDRALCSGVMSHISGLVADQTPPVVEHVSSGLGVEMGQKIGVVEDQKPVPETGASLDSVHQYDPSWWASSELDRLEALAQPQSPPRKPRKTTPPTYFSPTQASSAKVAEPLKMRKSLSGLSSLAKAAARPASPPPPEVPWTIAAHELCKLLIPSDRQTDSCKAEELNAEATRIRRDKQYDLLGLPPPSPSPAPPLELRSTPRMGLRGRRPKTAVSGDDESSDQADKNRARTSSSVPPADKKKPQQGRRTSRRLSGASTILTPTNEEPPPLPQSEKINRMIAEQSARPKSASSMQAPVGDRLPVKKVRATPTPSKQATPKATRSPRKATAPAASVKSTPRSTRKAPSRGNSANGSGGEMDKLTTGMKKIKINLITPSQREAVEKARQEGVRSSTASSEERTDLTPTDSQGRVSEEMDPTKSSTDAVDCITVSPTKVEVEPELPPLPSANISTPIRPQFAAEMATPDPRADTMPSSSPTASRAPTQPEADAADVFVPYQPGGPEPVPLTQQEPLKWLPANIPTPSANTPVATPIPVKRQDNLFKYKSGIPFAPRPQASAKGEGESVKTTGREN